MDLALNNLQRMMCDKTQPTNLRKGMNPLNPPAMSLIVSLLFYKDDFGIS